MKDDLINIANIYKSLLSDKLLNDSCFDEKDVILTEFLAKQFLQVISFTNHLFPDSNVKVNE